MASTFPDKFKKVKPAAKIGKNSKSPKTSRKIKERTRFILIKGIPPALCKENNIKESLKKVSCAKVVIFPSPESSLDSLCARLITNSENESTRVRRKSIAFLKKLCAASRNVDRFCITSVFIKETAKMNRLIVRNIPFSVTKKALFDLFSPLGKLCIDYADNESGINKGFAFVEFEDIANSEKAIKSFNGKKINGRKIVIDWSLSKQKFQNMTEKIAKSVQQKAEKSQKTEDQKDKTENQRDQTENKKIGTQNDKENEKSSDSDSDDENESEKDEPNSPKKSAKTDQIDKNPKKFDKSDADRNKTLFLRNLSVSTTESDLKSFFQKFGRIVYVRLVNDKETEKSKGSAFVKFRAKKSAEDFLKSHSSSTFGGQNGFVEFEISDRPCYASMAISKNKIDNLKKPKENIDKRNINLANEGLPDPSGKISGTASNALLRRERAWREKAERLKNPNLHVSRTRLSVQNIPPEWDEKKLKEAVLAVAKEAADVNKKSPLPRLKQVKIVRDKTRQNVRGQKRSRRFGFVEFLRHEDALEAVRRFSTKNSLKRGGLQVEFALDDMRILRKREERLNKTFKNGPKPKVMKRVNKVPEGRDNTAKNEAMKKFLFIKRRKLRKSNLKKKE